MSNRGLCWRCEHRALFHEGKGQSRYECGQNTAVVSCFMFQPVKPVILKKEKGDKRPMFAGWGVSAWVNPSEKEADLELSTEKKKDGWLLFWLPK